MNIVAAFKDEAPYLREWLEFHQMMGFDKFYLYNNNSTDDYLSVLRPYIDNNIVDLTEWPMPVPSQAAAYWDYISKHRGPWWTAVIDLDEFLWSPKYDTVTEALEAICQSTARSAIGANWMMFGSSGKEEYEDIPVIERFTWRCDVSNPVNNHVKSILWMDQTIGMAGDIHTFHTDHGTFNEHGAVIGSAFSAHSSEILRINHYYTKSRQEWHAKVMRGRADAMPRYEDDAFLKPETRCVDDREIWKFLPELKRRLGK
jgi:hypothetical protein